MRFLSPHFLLLASLVLCFPESGILLPAYPARTVSVETGIVKTAPYQVIGIKDGDTVDLLIEGKKVTVRLAHIDAPEKKQPFGTKAKQYLSDMCFGKKVRLLHKNKYDRNKRLLAEILTPEGINVNKALVKKGYAWHYQKFSDDNSYRNLELIARKTKSGLWTDAHPIAPWDWRGRKKIPLHRQKEDKKIHEQTTEV